MIVDNDQFLFLLVNSIDYQRKQVVFKRLIRVFEVESKHNFILIDGHEHRLDKNDDLIKTLIDIVRTVIKRREFKPELIQRLSV